MTKRSETPAMMPSAFRKSADGSAPPRLDTPPAIDPASGITMTRSRSRPSARALRARARRGAQASPPRATRLTASDARTDCWLRSSMTDSYLWVDWDDFRSADLAASAVARDDDDRLEEFVDLDRRVETI